MSAEEDILIGAEDIPLSELDEQALLGDEIDL